MLAFFYINFSGSLTLSNSAVFQLLLFKPGFLNLHRILTVFTLLKRVSNAHKDSKLVVPGKRYSSQTLF